MDWKNTLYVGDNLAILRDEIPDECVDLVYLDPPFNSNASYNVLFREPTGDESVAQVTAFEDAWAWGSESEHQYIEVIESGGDLATFLSAQRESLGTSNMMAYLVMMAPRLVELRRVLKPTGSIYLHCDPTASHYLKLLMDAVFGPESFLSEVIWKRTGTHSSALRWAPVHDVLLFYTKVRGKQTWNRLYVPLSAQHKLRHYRQVDTQGRLFAKGELTAPGVRNGRSGAPWRGFDVTSLGRHWITTVEKLDALDQAGRIHFPEDGGWPRLIRYEEDSKGRAVGDVWDDIPPLNMKARERLGYPTQKPEALLARILEASSNAGDVVLDPFCGCGTTINVAERMRRKWIGIDITYLAMRIIRQRLRDTFELEPNDYRVRNFPEDLASARALAEQDRFEFQWWVFDRLHVRTPTGNLKKKGPDAGIDGTIPFVDDPSGKAKKVVVQVKSGHVKVSDVRDLRGVIEREKAEIGVLVTLEPPSKPMQNEAAAAGIYRSPGNPQVAYDRIQILTTEALLAGAAIHYPRPAGYAAQPPRPRPARKPKRVEPAPNQLELELPLPETPKAPQRRTPFQEVIRRRVAVASVIVNQLHSEKHFGRTKFAKLIYLADMHCKLGLQMEYTRQAAGPLDGRALYNEKIGIEAVAKLGDVFTAEEGPDFVRYKPGPKLERITKLARELLGASPARELEGLVTLLSEMNTDQVEIVATLYACWNDLLLHGQQPEDDAIVEEFLVQWHERKRRFSRPRLTKALAWMRENGVVPTGSGKRTAYRPQRD